MFDPNVFIITLYKQVIEGHCLDYAHCGQVSESHCGFISTKQMKLLSEITIQAKVVV